MDHRTHGTLLVALALVALHGSSEARRTAIRGKLAADGLAVVALEPDGHAVSSRQRAFTILTSASSGRLIVLDGDTTVRGPLVLGIVSQGRTYSVPQALAEGACASPDARAILRFRVKGRKPMKLGRLTVGARMAYPKRRLRPAMLDAASGLAEVDTDCVPRGAGRLGVTAAVQSGGELGRSDALASGLPGGSAGGAFVGEADPDGDGLPNAFDADDDGDGILDNDDPDSRGGGASGGAARFWVFSNFHHEIEDSLNANAMPLTKALVDAALVRASGLAFQVAGGGAAGDVELDCGTLPYCSAGGTGRTREPYPDGVEFPEDVDPDGDGLGTITAGPSGDFQFRPFGAVPPGYPASDMLRAGDVYLQRYADGEGAVVEVPGMLNFVFHTTPAVKTVQTGVRTYEVAYPVVPGSPGTRGNPFHVPTAGDATVTLTVWRPQRQGIAEAGEASLMDMGNLRLVTNLPQGPCDPAGPGGCPSGPGLCPSSVYGEADPNLGIVFDGLQDALGDRPADPANAFTYTIDLSACVETVPGVSWDAGETLMVPVQMMNVYGDNAAQNVYFVRDDS